MINSEHTRWVLNNYGPLIRDVALGRDGVVRANLESWIDPKRPYALVIRTNQETLRLQMSISSIWKIRRDSMIHRLLLGLNLNLLNCGRIAVKIDGQVVLKMDYFCDDNDRGPSPRMIERLLDECIRELRIIEDVLLWATLMEVGLPPDRARQTVKALFASKWESLDANDNSHTMNHPDQNSNGQKLKGDN